MLDTMSLACKNNIQKTLKAYLYFFSQGVSKGGRETPSSGEDKSHPQTHSVLRILLRHPERKNIDMPSGSFVYCFYMLETLCPASRTPVQVEIRVLSLR